MPLRSLSPSSDIEVASPTRWHALRSPCCPAVPSLMLNSVHTTKHTPAAPAPGRHAAAHAVRPPHSLLAPCAAAAAAAATVAPPARAHASTHLPPLIPAPPHTALFSGVGPWISAGCARGKQGSRRGTRAHSVSVGPTQAGPQTKRAHARAHAHARRLFHACACACQPTHPSRTPHPHPHLRAARRRGALRARTHPPTSHPSHTLAPTRTCDPRCAGYWYCELDMCVTAPEPPGWPCTGGREWRCSAPVAPGRGKCSRVRSKSVHGFLAARRQVCHGGLHAPKKKYSPHSNPWTAKQRQSNGKAAPAYP